MCVGLCILESGSPQRLEEGVKSPGAKVTGDCEPPNVGLPLGPERPSL